MLSVIHETKTLHSRFWAQSEANYLFACCFEQLSLDKQQQWVRSSYLKIYLRSLSSSFSSSSLFAPWTLWALPSSWQGVSTIILTAPLASWQWLSQLMFDISVSHCGTVHNVPLGQHCIIYCIASSMTFLDLRKQALESCLMLLLATLSCLRPVVCMCVCVFISVCMRAAY